MFNYGCQCTFLFLFLALALFAEKRPPSSAFNFTPHFVEVHGSRMHYVEAGKGDPILLLHGNPTSAYIWRNIIPYLSKHGRVIAVDLIGFGRSDKPDIEYRFADHAAYLEGFIEKLALRNLTLVMHDWGSALGFDYAASHEGKIRALAFFEALLVPLPSLDQWPNQRAAEAFRLYRTPKIGWDLIVQHNDFLERRLQEGVLRQLSEAELSQYRAPFLEAVSRKPLWRWPNELPIAGEPADVAMVQAHYLAWLQTSNLPKLLLYAKPGALTPEPVVAWAKHSLTNLTTVDLGDGIHNLQEDHPEEIGHAVAAWIEQTKGKSGRR